MEESSLPLISRMLVPKYSLFAFRNSSASLVRKVVMAGLLF
jgi:hypothetical protein